MQWLLLILLVVNLFGIVSLRRILKPFGAESIMEKSTQINSKLDESIRWSETLSRALAQVQTALDSEWAFLSELRSSPKNGLRKVRQH